MTVATLFGVIQIPIVGAIVGFVVFRQQRKTQPDVAGNTRCQRARVPPFSMPRLNTCSSFGKV